MDRNCINVKKPINCFLGNLRDIIAYHGLNLEEWEIFALSNSLSIEFSASSSKNLGFVIKSESDIMLSVCRSLYFRVIRKKRDFFPIIENSIKNKLPINAILNSSILTYYTPPTYFRNTSARHSCIIYHIDSQQILFIDSYCLPDIYHTLSRQKFERNCYCTYIIEPEGNFTTHIDTFAKLKQNLKHFIDPDSYSSIYTLNKYFSTFFERIDISSDRFIKYLTDLLYLLKIQLCFVNEYFREIRC